MPRPRSTLNPFRSQQPQTADVLIIGAGFAGLSLATHLVLAGERTRKIVLLEDRRDAHGRSIVGFNDAMGPFEPLATDRWNLWRVGDGTNFVDGSAEGMALLHLPADRFYAHCHGLLGAASNVRLLDDRAATIRGDGVVTTARGEVWHAGVVFDSRPPADDATRGRRHDTRLWRQSVSFEVTADRDFFRPELATLADFSVPQRGGVRFVTLLPHDSRHARVEVTALLPRRVHDDRLEAVLIRYLRGLGLANPTLRHRETDCVVLSTASMSPWAGRRVRRIGAAAGAIKPCTGETFAAVQRDCAAIAAAIRTDQPVPGLRQPWVSRMVDRLVLHAAARRPSAAGQLAIRLCEAVPHVRLKRWVNDNARLGDVTAVLQSLPRWPLLLAGLQNLGRLVPLPARPFAPVPPTPLPLHAVADDLDEDILAA